MQTLSILPAGTIRLSAYPGQTPDLLLRGAPSFVLCDALARKRQAENPYAPFDVLLEQTFVEADRQAARIGLPTDAIRYRDVREELSHPLPMKPSLAEIDKRTELEAEFRELQARRTVHFTQHGGIFLIHATGDRAAEVLTYPGEVQSGDRDPDWTALLWFWERCGERALVPVERGRGGTIVRMAEAA